MKKAQADTSAIEAAAELVSPQAVNIERSGFAVPGEVSGQSKTPELRQERMASTSCPDAQLVADIREDSPGGQERGSGCGGEVNHAARRPVSRHTVKSSGRTPTMS
jgi:hypothetical protein